MRKGERISNREFEFCVKGGRTITALFSAQLLEIAGESHVLSSISDITERKRAQENLKRQNQFTRTILDNLPIGLAVNRFAEEKATYMNKAFEQIYGWPTEELTDIRNFFQKLYPDPTYRKEVETRIREDIASGDPDRMEWDRIEITRKGGQKRIVRAKNIPLLEQNLMISTVQDETERYAAERALRESEERFSIAFKSSPAPLVVSEIDTGLFLDVNDRWVEMLEFTREEQIGKTSKEVGIWEDPSERDRLVAKLRTQSRIRDEPITFRTKSNRPIFALWSAEAITLSGKAVMLSMITDITNLKRAEEEQQKLNEQLVQAQKLESVGRLAGGVAHDFNNMLNVIRGHSELLLDDLPADSPLREDIEEIQKSADRSANLTRQLLAFARRQTTAPRILDLNKTVFSMLRMLRRLIGEDIELLWKPGENLEPIRMDPGQIDQILANLAINARDAIEDVGTVNIETANVTLDEQYCAAHAGFVPGDYVILVVRDDGCGMDDETQASVFEPFFTTKKIGEGTGLGLATVYGIVKQNEGFIRVDSEPGRGTTFQIYLPAHQSQKARKPTDSDGAAVPPARGNEFILLVEDEPSVLNISRTILQRLGYRVVATEKPGEAVRLAEEHAGSIHLLLTDIVMPEMNGRDLADRLQKIYPDLKVLFMSGYTADAIVPRRHLQEGINLMQKPFSSRELALRVREVLDGTEPSSK